MKTLHDWNPDSPCRFNQYINENGTIGKVYYLESGATVKINNADFIPVFEKSQREQEKRNKLFHERLSAMGVKAYRVNDGWVDRKNCKVTFFSHNKTYGFYWYNNNLQKGDLIFIGTESYGGRFAIIENKEYEISDSVTYTYSPTQTIIDGKYGPYKTKNNLTKIDKVLMFLGVNVRVCTDIYNEER